MKPLAQPNFWIASKYLQVGGGFGHIFPGTFLNNTTPGEFSLRVHDVCFLIRDAASN